MKKQFIVALSIVMMGAGLAHADQPNMPSPVVVPTDNSSDVNTESAPCGCDDGSGVVADTGTNTGTQGFQFNIGLGNGNGMSGLGQLIAMLLGGNMNSGFHRYHRHHRRPVGAPIFVAPNQNGFMNAPGIVPVGPANGGVIGAPRFVQPQIGSNFGGVPGNGAMMWNSGYGSAPWRFGNSYGSYGNGGRFVYPVNAPPVTQIGYAGPLGAQQAPVAPPTVRIM
jgi:hypothetical protein